MLRELLSIFRSERPLAEMGENFTEMLKTAYEMTLAAGDIYFGDADSPENRTGIYQRDVHVNKMERTIRKQVIAHLSLAGTSASLPYCLLLMSLVKDVERLGDYAKNLSEVRDYHPDPLPDDDFVGELREIRSGTESAFAATADVFTTADRARALELTRVGRELTHRCDALIERVASGNYNAREAVALAMGARYYKRIAAHVLNVLSSVVMPLHKLDYYDEDVLEDFDEDDD
jgi:phosphate transport system protein